MLTNHIIKYIQSLSQKKFRDQHATFVVEGLKSCLELISQIPSQYLIVTEKTKKEFGRIDFSLCENIITIDDKEFKKISNLKTPQNVLAIFRKPLVQELKLDKDELALALDDIQDPGNLGTIIRLADWYGIKNIICSLNTVDVYNPKVIQATMGAIARVKCHYTNLSEFLTKQRNIPIYGTFLDGEDIYHKQLSKGGILVMGNEGNGISNVIASLTNEKLYIPTYPTDNQNTESLNVSIATAIVCAEFRRRSR